MGRVRTVLTHPVNYSTTPIGTLGDKHEKHDKHDKQTSKQEKVNR